MAFFAWALATCSQDCKSLCCIVTASAGWTQLNVCHIPLTSSQSQVEKIFCRTLCSGTFFTYMSVHMQVSSLEQEAEVNQLFSFGKHPGLNC